MTDWESIRETWQTIPVERYAWNIGSLKTQLRRKKNAVIFEMVFMVSIGVLTLIIAITWLRPITIKYTEPLTSINMVLGICTFTVAIGIIAVFFLAPSENDVRARHQFT